MIGAKMKYVVFDGYNGEEIIIFPKIIQHSVMADDVKKSSFGGMKPISGGFVIDGQCVGESESLRMKSRYDLDTALISKLLDTDEKDDIEVSEYVAKVAVDTISKNRAKRLRKKQAKR
jgi:hypothetical protein